MANVLAYGFVGKEHLFAETLNDANTATVDAMIAQSVAIHNEQVNRIMAEMVFRTQNHKVRFKLPSGGSLQPLDEYGNPYPVRREGYYDVAFPILGGGTAWGDNRVTRALMTVGDVNDNMMGVMRRDADWIKRHILASLLDKTAWTFDDEQYGSLTIQPLANGDSAEYLRLTGDTSTANHYVAQAATIGDAASPFANIYSTLSGYVANVGSTIVSYIPTNLKTAVMGLSDFYEVIDPELRVGNASTTLAGTIDRGMGDEVLGRVDKVWVVEMKMLPDDYVLSVARNASSPVLGMREYPSPALQGLFREEHTPDGNMNVYRFIRYAGFGAFNRVGARVDFIEAGDTTYDTPSAYNAPLAA